MSELPSGLQILAVLLGSGLVPLVIFLFSRRAQLRQLNTTSDVNLVNQATALVGSLQSEINRAREDNSRLAAKVTQLQTELDIARNGKAPNGF